MRSAFAPLAFAALVAATPMPAQTAADPPAGCSTSYDGTFEIQVVNVTNSAKRSLSKRAAVVASLSNGVLTDSKGRTGEIVANHQFQFDNPIQSGAIYTSGWSVCSNGSLAIGDNAVFYQCLSGDFYNLYDESIGGQCTPIYIEVIQSGSSVASAIPDGQVTASAVASQQSDGQVTAGSAVPVTQISDGQIQATTGAPVTQISDGQVQAPTSTAVPITQISDGQVQAPTSTAVPITQISDGQIQAPTSTAVPITQISDGQVQAPTSTAVPITQISDGQVQAPTSVAPISQISDGQIQAPVATGTGYLNTSSTASPSPYVGAGSAVQTSFGLGFGAFLLAFFL